VVSANNAGGRETATLMTNFLPKINNVNPQTPLQNARRPGGVAAEDYFATLRTVEVDAVATDEEKRGKSTCPDHQ
jgi:hypothetical protein